MRPSGDWNGSCMLVSLPPRPMFLSIFFFNDTATTEIYTLSLHDALPISCGREENRRLLKESGRKVIYLKCDPDRKSTRLNSSHTVISYAVFCLKKKKKTKREASSTTHISIFSLAARQRAPADEKALAGGI